MWQEAAPAANLSCQHGLLLLRKWLHWFGVLCSWPFKLLTCIVYKTCWVNHWLLSTRYIYYQQLCCFSIDEGHQKYKAEGYWNNGPKANLHLDSADSPINCFPINDDMLLEHVEDNLSLDGQLNLIRSTYIPHQEVTFWKSQINPIFMIGIFHERKSKRIIWRCRGLNPGPFTCKANALPLRYIPSHNKILFEIL